MTKRKRRPTHFYTIIKTEYGSKEDLFSHRPSRMLVILDEVDIATIKRYSEFSKGEKNPDGFIISIEYPINIEYIWFEDEDDDMDDEDCIFIPAGSHIKISGDFMYMKTCDSNDCWDIVEGEFFLDKLKPMTEWALEEVTLNLEN